MLGLVFLLLPLMASTLPSEDIVPIAQSKTMSGTICSSEKTCFKSPKGCESYNCEAIISFNETSMTFVGDHIDEFDYLAVYSETKGKRDEEFILCFFGTHCWRAVEGKDEYMKMKFKLDTIYVDLSNSKHMYALNGIVLPTGPDVSYSFRVGHAENPIVNPPSTTLFHDESTKLATSYPMNLYGKPLRDFFEHKKIHAMEHNNNGTELEITGSEILGL